MTYDELRRIAAEVAPRRGWDFSQVRDDRDPVPWEYDEVVRRYLRPGDRVLDVGTGGGERFIALAPSFGTGVGVDPDPEMVRAARENIPVSLAETVSFVEGRAEALPVPDSAFDVVLNRHAVVDVAEVMRILRPGGYFITQQVGAQNTFNIATLFGTGSGMGGQHAAVARDQEIPALAEAFQGHGCAVVSYATYNVPYYFRDAASLLFWMRAVGVPPDFDIERHWQQVEYLLSEYATPRGTQTNEHRELLIIRTAAVGGSSTAPTQASRHRDRERVLYGGAAGWKARATDHSDQCQSWTVLSLMKSQSISSPRPGPVGIDT
ncbi:MAG: methyltransferase domain-containing protein [Thermomicrobia bacterium]|nr:methyltransferase domain-containing protein [Thermomicrobia bacterium]